jgi:hypothetical protein
MPAFVGKKKTCSFMCGRSNADRDLVLRLFGGQLRVGPIWSPNMSPCRPKWEYLALMGPTLICEARIWIRFGFHLGHFWIHISHKSHKHMGASSGPIAVCLNELAEYCLGEYGPTKEALEHFFPAGGLQQDVRDAAFSLYALVFDCIEV